jgi:predicted esterase
LTWLLAAALGSQDIPRGRVVERIVCADHPDQSYALYLPSTYAPERPSPAIYLLDARGHALVPVERFREAAEDFGWILISSYNSRSDTTDDPNTPAVNSMWNDTHARLAIDGRRTYVGGFSGGGRVAVGMALRAPDRIAGVIGCGAGFPDESAPIEALPFAYFGTVGDRDFNYLEMRSLDARLTAAKSPHRVVIFAGGHDWPPAEVAREAIAWMELQAVRAGARTTDAPSLASLYRSDLARADALSAEGRAGDASRRFAEIAWDFRGLTDTSEASARAAALQRDPAIQKSLRDAIRRDERDSETLRSLVERLRRSLGAAELPPARKVSIELGIPALQRKARSADSPEERLSAERILANLRVQTSFYLPRRFLDVQDHPRALLALAVAAEIDPDDPSVSYNLAAAFARTGDAPRALRELKRAVDRGFRRFDALGSDPDFATLRESAAFRKWLSEVRRLPDPPPP